MAKEGSFREVRGKTERKKKRTEDLSEKCHGNVRVLVWTNDCGLLKSGKDESMMRPSDDRAAGKRKKKPRKTKKAFFIRCKSRVKKRVRSRSAGMCGSAQTGAEQRRKEEVLWQRIRISDLSIIMSLMRRC